MAARPHMASRTLLVLQYEIHGKVQGVFFRKSTAAEATRLGLTGWVQNTPNGTVVGEAHGPKAELDKLGERLARTRVPIHTFVFAPDARRGVPSQRTGCRPRGAKSRG
mgnify:FL=1